MPVHVGFGNHDYAVPQVSREASHELFRRKLGVQPYYAVDHRGWKFIHVNNFLGTTWQAGHADYRKQVGSLGETQLTLARRAAGRAQAHLRVRAFPAAAPSRLPSSATWDFTPC